MVFSQGRPSTHPPDPSRPTFKSITSYIPKWNLFQSQEGHEKKFEGRLLEGAIGGGGQTPSESMK